MKHLVILAATLLALASTALPVAAADTSACSRYIQRAEAANGIPAGLLLSIAFAESSYRGSPWPWTLNIGGAGRYLDSKNEAISLLTDAKGNLKSNVDVGCMQINTLYHGRQFDSAQSMLDPETNVRYGARFLKELKDSHGSWIEAVGRYHASKPEAQRSYICRVLHHRIRLGFQARNLHVNQLCAGINRKLLVKG